MSRRSRVVEEDFDDDEKVEYLDCDETDVASNVEQGARTPRRDKSSTRFKPLFQQKRYKGELEGEKYSELFDIEELVSKATKQPAANDDFVDQPILETADSPVVSKKAKVSDRSETSYSHTDRRTDDQRPGQGRRDVADDRPAHWNRMRMAPVRAAAARPNTTTRGASAVNPGTTRRPVRPIQIPKPKALPAPTVTPAAVGNGLSLPTAVSFKPSWMTSSRSTGTAAIQPTTGNRGTMNRSSVVAADSPVISAAAMEDIQDDAVSQVRPFTTPARASTGLQFNSGGSQMPVDRVDDGAAEAYTRHSLSASAGVDGTGLTGGNAGGLFLSPERQQSSRYDYGLDSSERAPASSGALHRTGSTRGGGGGSKARPGSLKAKLLKVQRDIDAAENRIVNVPVDRSSRAVDLQDPRQRAVRYLDAEVVAVMGDRTPFKVVRLEVTGVWCKGGDATDATSPVVGSALLGYFKPDSCTGQGRELAAGVRLRVFDGLVVKVGAEHRLLCTGCWEPLTEG